MGDLWGDEVNGPEVGGSIFDWLLLLESHLRGVLPALGGLRVELLLRAGVQEGHLAAQC